MTLNEYQEYAARTINPGLNSGEVTFHGVFGLCSEAGEIASLFQKRYQGHDFDREHLVKEMGDCLWMLAEIATIHGITMDEVGAANIEKLRARYPQGFTKERSLHRAEGDI